jgi:hypothetical protein
MINTYWRRLNQRVSITNSVSSAEALTRRMRMMGRVESSTEGCDKEEEKR